jgi:chromosome segregation ATPase
LEHIQHHIKRIQNKLQLLLKQQENVQQENVQLKKSLAALKDSNAQYETQLNQLEQQVSILKTAAGNMNQTDKKQFEKQISQYIREIDKCIVLLGE